MGTQPTRHLAQGRLGTRLGPTGEAEVGMGLRVIDAEPPTPRVGGQLGKPQTRGPGSFAGGAVGDRNENPNIPENSVDTPWGHH